MRTLPLLMTVVACAPEATDAPAPTRDELVEAAADLGAYDVGYAQASVTYATPLDDARVIDVEIWYPATFDDEQPAFYALQDVVEVQSEVARLEPAVADGVFDVALYSHGSGGVGVLAQPYAERLASHGWVVVAPDHAGNTTLDLIAGGGAPFLATTLHRPLDVHAVLDAVEAGLGPVPAASVDVERSFVWGHSFGGYTTLAVGGATFDLDAFLDLCGDSDDASCALARDPDVQAAFEDGFLDPRLDAIAPQAPALVPSFRDGDVAGIDVPVMMMSAKGDLTTPDAEEAGPAWEALDGDDDVWLRIPNGGHYSFITICEQVGLDLIDRFQQGASEDGCGEDFDVPSELVDAMTTYLVAFGETHVRGVDERVVWTEGEPLHPGIRVVLP